MSNYCPINSPEHASHALLLRARGGDETALDELVRRSLDALHVFVRLRMDALVGSRSEATDVVQETLTRALRGLDSFEDRGVGSFTAWLCRIAQNTMGAMRAHHGAEKRRASSEERISRILELATSRAGPRTLTFQKAENARLERAMAALDEAERDVLLQRFFEGRALREIAEARSSSTTSVHRLLGRATASLGRALRADLSGAGASAPEESA